MCNTYGRTTIEYRVKFSFVDNFILFKYMQAQPKKNKIFFNSLDQM